MKKQNIFFLGFISIVLVPLLCGCVNQNNWPGWRGPNGNGIVMETNWYPQKLDSNAIVWRKNVGQGHSAISIKGKYCYASGWKSTPSDNDTINETTIYCLDIKTGDEIWKFSYEAAWINFPGPRSTPAIDNNKLYHLGWEGVLYCLNAKNGYEIWHHDLYADSLGFRRGGSEGYCTSPVIHNDLLLLCIGTTGLALNKNTGETVWKSDKKGSSNVSPVLFEYQGKTSALITSDSTLSAVAVEDGSVLWQYEKVTGNRGLEPIVEPENKIFLASEYIKYNGSTELIWKNEKVASVFQTGVVLNGYAYQFGWDQFKDMGLHCIELETGKLMWHEKMVRWGALIAADDKLIILKGKGELAIAEANTEKYTEIASYQVLPDTGNPQFIGCWTSPSMANGYILIRNFGGDIACVYLGN